MTSCPASYYLCPASFNYGCCLTGYGCATNACYVTTPSTATYTQTATTTDAGGQTITTTRTATTVQTPTPPTAVPLTSNPNAVAKFIPTSVEKVPATSSPSSGGGGGLTKPQLGGIIGGAVALLLAVVVAAFIVIRRLNRVANVVGTPKTSSSGDQSKSNHRPAAMAQQYGGHRPSPSEIDGMGYDPLMMPNTPGDGSSSAAGTPQGGWNGGGRNRSDSDYSQQANTPYGASDAAAAARHPSMDSNPAGAGYFDIPRVHNMPGGRPATTMRASVDSQGNVVQYVGGHGRQWSNTSELSNGSSDTAHGVGSPLIPAELDVAGGFIPELDVSPADGGRRPRSGTSSTVGSPRPSLNNRRYSSSGSGAAGGGLPSPGNQPLDPVNESTEVMHGHYGPRHGQVGQTAAGLDIQHDITSPVAVPFQERE